MDLDAGALGYNPLQKQVSRLGQSVDSVVLDYLHGGSEDVGVSDVDDGDYRGAEHLAARGTKHDVVCGTSERAILDQAGGRSCGVSPIRASSVAKRSVAKRRGEGEGCVAALAGRSGVVLRSARLSGRKERRRRERRTREGVNASRA
eukprot:6213416-Pleurochrysis_carterae.AAC.8